MHQGRDANCLVIGRADDPDFCQFVDGLGKRPTLPFVVELLPPATSLQQCCSRLRKLSHKNPIVVAPESWGDSYVASRSLLDAGAVDVYVAGEPVSFSALLQNIDQFNAVEERIKATFRSGLLGQSVVMRRARLQIARASLLTDLPVLITGETGTGKFIAARTIHEVDKERADEPFYAVNCATISETLYGSELFGHVKGAFTGARDNRIGAFGSAGKGTLVLDEIGELPLTLQATLLTVLQERSFSQVGADRCYDVRCRIVAATNRDLREEVRAGSFRSDLLFRLDGIHIEMPPVREHPEDVTPMFLDYLARIGRSSGYQLSAPAQRLLATHPFPGNVRELEIVARQTLVNLGESALIRLAHLPLDRFEREAAHPRVASQTIDEMVAHGMSMKEIEDACASQAVQAAISRYSGVGATRTDAVRKAASALRVSPRTIYNKSATSNDG